jgi:hypothetical protein
MLRGVLPDASPLPACRGVSLGLLMFAWLLFIGRGIPVRGERLMSEVMMTFDGVGRNSVRAGGTASAFIPDRETDVSTEHARISRPRFGH